MENVGAQVMPNNINKYNVDDFGALGDAIKLCTENIQAAIDECHEQGGGIVTFGPGKYLTGSIFVKSNVNLHIPK